MLPPLGCGRNIAISSSPQCLDATATVKATQTRRQTSTWTMTRVETEESTPARPTSITTTAVRQGGRRSVREARPSTTSTPTLPAAQGAAMAVLRPPRSGRRAAELERRSGPPSERSRRVVAAQAGKRKPRIQPSDAELTPELEPTRQSQWEAAPGPQPTSPPASPRGRARGGAEGREHVAAECAFRFRSCVGLSAQATTAHSRQTRG